MILLLEYLLTDRCHTLLFSLLELFLLKQTTGVRSNNKTNLYNFCWRVAHSKRYFPKPQTLYQPDRFKLSRSAAWPPFISDLVRQILCPCSGSTRMKAGRTRGHCLKPKTWMSLQVKWGRDLASKRAYDGNMTFSPLRWPHVISHSHCIL